MPGGHGDVESIGPEGQEVEAEAPPPAARRPRHVAELADLILMRVRMMK